MTGTDPNDVRYPWEEPGEEAGVAQPAPPADRGAPSLEEHRQVDAVLEPAEAAAPASEDSEPGDPPAEGRAPWPSDEGPGSPPRERPIAPKEYYAISEVCDLVDLKPHVLRYWETQFGVLNPSKNRSGNRVYQRKEIKLILLVKHLLYEEKYTVEGAKQKLEQLRRGGELGAATALALDAGTIDMLRTELHRLAGILTVLEPD